MGACPADTSPPAARPQDGHSGQSPLCPCDNTHCAGALSAVVKPDPEGGWVVLGLGPAVLGPRIPPMGHPGPQESFP